MTSRGPTPAYREGYQHTFELGNTLATALLPPEQAAELNAPAWQLRSELTRLLGEHVGLALGALRAGATNSPDFPAAVDALNGNTTDVTAAVGSLFGDPAASQFMTLWADHLDLLGNYAADVGAKKENRRDAVQGELRDWQQRFATFIDTATGSRMAAPDLAAALLGLDDLLLGQVDAFAARDYQQAQELADQTYPQVFGLARNMADAFGATVAARMPQGGAQTGGGGMAGALVPPAAAAPPPAALATGAGRRRPAFRSVRTYQEVALPVRLRIPAVRIDTPLQQLGRAADRDGRGARRLRRRRLVRRRAPAGSGRAGGDPRPRRLAARPRRLLPAGRAGAGHRGAGGPRGRQHGRVPGDQRAAGPEGRVPHRPGLRAYAAIVTAARDVRWLVRPRSRELPGQCHRVRRSGAVAGRRRRRAARAGGAAGPGRRAGRRRAAAAASSCRAGRRTGRSGWWCRCPTAPRPLRPDAFTASVAGVPQPARAEPVLSDRLAMGLVVDASDDGGAGAAGRAQRRGELRARRPAVGPQRAGHRRHAADRRRAVAVRTGGHPARAQRGAARRDPEHRRRPRSGRRPAAGRGDGSAARRAVHRRARRRWRAGRGDRRADAVGGWCWPWSAWSARHRRRSSGRTVAAGTGGVAVAAGPADVIGAFDRWRPRWAGATW